MVQHSFDMALPAVEVDNEIDLCRLSRKPLGMKMATPAVGVVLLGGKEFAVVSVTLSGAGDEERGRKPIGRESTLPGRRSAGRDPHAGEVSHGTAQQR